MTEGVLSTARQVNALVDQLTQHVALLAEQNQELGGDDVLSKAEHMRSNIIPALTAVRDVVDRLEPIVNTHDIEGLNMGGDDDEVEGPAVAGRVDPTV